MWGDAKVMALSRPPPCGQVLWVHLLAGEQTDIIPGLFKIGEAAFAEQLGWDMEGFRKAFREVLSQRLVEADWKARVVFVPNAIRHNPPANPNVVTSWADAWDRIPECGLKLKAWGDLKAFIEGMSKGFQEAFERACRKPSRNQEQDQEQDQEIQKDSCPEMNSGPPSPQHASTVGEGERPPGAPAKAAPSPPPDDSPIVAALPCVGNGPKEFHVTAAMCAAWTKAYPAVDVMLEIGKAVQWAADNPRQRKTAAGARSFLGRWLAREQNQGPRSRAPQAGMRAPAKPEAFGNGGFRKVQ